MVPSFGAAYAAPNKDATILYDLEKKTVSNPTVNGKIQGLFKASECFSSSTFSRQILFSRTFQDSPVYSSTFQACANRDYARFLTLIGLGQQIVRAKNCKYFQIHYFNICLNAQNKRLTENCKYFLKLFISF